MTRLITLFAALLVSLTLQAKPFEDFVPVSKKMSLFVRHTPAIPGKDTLVILSGLTHEIKNWDKLLKELKVDGLGILIIDLAGQGRTLAKHSPVTDVIKYQDQADYVAAVVRNRGLHSRVSVLGLSYGGGIATVFAAKYPQMVKRLILMAPYTEPQPEQDKWIRDQIRATRIAFPYNPATDDELYDYYLRQLVYTVYPAAEPELLTIPFKLEAVFRMAQGIRKLHLSTLTHRLPAKSVHLMVGKDDQLVKPEVLERFWSAVPGFAKSSRLMMERTEHSIAELQPKLSATWIKMILSDDPRTTSGQTYLGNPKSGSITKQ